MPDARFPIEMVKGVSAVAAPAEIDAGGPGWPQTLLRNVEEWNSPTGELTPLSALGCLPAQVKLAPTAG